MDRSQLARLMLVWEAKRAELDDLESAIRDAVLEVGHTVDAGNVRASYNSGRTTYDYQAAWEQREAEAQKAGPEAQWHLEKILDEYTTTTIKVDYRKACDEAGVAKEMIPATVGEPSVSIKLLPPE